MSKDALFTTLALSVPCNLCKAESHDWCTTTSGSRSTRLHLARTRPIAMAWKGGWDERNGRPL